MSTTTCLICNKTKTALRCNHCNDPSCKHCSYFIDEDAFEMLSLLPDSLQNKTFCSNCYHQKMGAELDHYKDLMEKAKKVDVYSKEQSSETRRIRRIEKPIQVRDCEDKNEALMRLAFIAVEKGFTTIVDFHLKSEKVGSGKAYKKLIWNASAVPVDPRLKK